MMPPTLALILINSFLALTCLSHFQRFILLVVVLITSISHCGFLYVVEVFADYYVVHPA
jgi:hypothetical protein